MKVALILSLLFVSSMASFVLIENNSTTNDTWGLHQFVVGMKTRLKIEHEDTIAAHTVITSGIQKHLDELSKRKTAFQQAIVGQDNLLEKPLEQKNMTILAVKQAKQLIEAKTLTLGQAEEKFRQAESDANAATADFQLQTKNTRQAIDACLKVRAALQGSKPEETIMEVLVNNQDLELGLAEFKDMLHKAPSIPNAPPSLKSEFFQSLTRLEEDLGVHMENIEEASVESNHTNGKMLEELAKAVEAQESDLEGLQNDIKVNIETIAFVQKRIDELNEQKAQYYRDIADIEKEVKRFQENLEYENMHFANQEKNEKLRIQDMKNFHATVIEAIENPSTRPFILHIMGSANETDLLGNITKTIKKIPPMPASELHNKSWARYQFEESQGSIYAEDSSAHGFQGKLHGMTMSRYPGAKGSALVFDGVNDYVDVGRLGDLGLCLSNFSISFFMKTKDTHPALASIMKYIDPHQSSVLSIETNRRVGKPNFDGTWPTDVQGSDDLSYCSGSTLFYLRDAQGRVLAGSINSTLYDGKWHHVQWNVEDAIQNIMSVYVDSEPVAFEALVNQSPFAFKNLQTNLFIGAGNNRGVAEGFYDGMLDEVTIFDTPQRPIYGMQCCQICRSGVACGDKCQAREASCKVARGCACNVDEVH